MLSMMSEIGEHENGKIQYDQIAENFIMNKKAFGI